MADAESLNLSLFEGSSPSVLTNLKVAQGTPGVPISAQELIWLEGAENAIQAWRKASGKNQQ